MKEESSVPLKKARQDASEKDALKSASYIKRISTLFPSSAKDKSGLTFEVFNDLLSDMDEFLFDPLVKHGLRVFDPTFQPFLEEK